MSPQLLNRFKRKKRLELPLCQTLLFPFGLFGFEHLKSYELRGEEAEIPFLRLFAKEEEVSFITIDPFLVCEDYDAFINSEDIKSLGTGVSEDYFLLGITRIEKKKLYINLSAPLLIYWEKKVGKQLLLPGQPTAYPFELS